MSIAPANDSGRPVADVAATSAAPGRWYEKLSGLLFAILCFELGIFLIAFPWSQYWSQNYFSWLNPGWRGFWMDPYVRGAVSGLGFVNLYVSMMEVVRLQRSRGGHQPEP